MIITFILSAILGACKAIFYIMPSLPDLPQFLQDGTTYFTDLVSQVVGFVAYIYTPQMFIFSLTALLVTMNFKHVYFLVMFVARKLPLGIK